MRLPQLLLPLLIAAWLFLAAVGWTVAALLLRREPRLTVMLLGLLVGLAAAFAPAAVGQRGTAGLIASFPLAFAVSLAVCALVAARRQP